MSRSLVVLVVFMAGCTVGSPEDLRPFVAVAGKYSLMDKPAPAPSPSGVCENCRGTGKVGDGRVMVTCPVCDGTGKPKTAPECKDGTCPTPKIIRR